MARHLWKVLVFPFIAIFLFLAWLTVDPKKWEVWKSDAKWLCKCGWHEDRNYPFDHEKYPKLAYCVRCDRETSAYNDMW